LLPREHVFLRTGDHCFDVNTSTDRSNLLEKFLSKHYNLIAENNGRKALNSENLNNQNCQLELKTTKRKKQDSTSVSLGKFSSASKGTNDFSEVSTSQILLGLGKSGSLELEGRSLNVECSGGGRGIYQLVFFFSEENRAKINTQMSVKKGEVVQIASITNDLNNQTKTLGFPQSVYQEVSGSENINYELQIK
jgi:hypothetical protein